MDPTEKRMTLGISEKQAADMMIMHTAKGTHPQGITQAMSQEFLKEYKYLTRGFFQANCELHAEILEGQSIEAPQRTQPAPEAPKARAAPQQRQPSENQMFCPNGCGKIIPKSWRRHDECGWKQ